MSTLTPDHLDRLPDSILLVIFNRISDIKSLGRLRAVSLRFNSVVRHVDNASVRIDCVISDDPAAPSDKPRGVLSHLARALLGGIVRPIFALSQILSSPSKRLAFTQVSHYSPSQVLKSFTEIRRLRIELPAGELRLSDGVVLKWKADFGSSINTCVIICSGEDNGSGNSNISESFYANGGLKLRVLWTISSLIAASARHYLLQPIVSDHRKLEFLDLVDADGQGVLSMNRRQLQELVVNPVSASGSSHRTLMPALSMRLWYEPLLELLCGMMLKGATLVAIQPSEERSGDSCEVAADLEWVLNAFDETYGGAARMLMERRSYCLEMNSF